MNIVLSTDPGEYRELFIRGADVIIREIMDDRGRSYGYCFVYVRGTPTPPAILNILARLPGYVYHKDDDFGLSSAPLPATQHYVARTPQEIRDALEGNTPEARYKKLWREYLRWCAYDQANPPTAATAANRNREKDSFLDRLDGLCLGQGWQPEDRARLQLEVRAETDASPPTGS